MPENVFTFITKSDSVAIPVELTIRKWKIGVRIWHSGAVHRDVFL